MFTADQQKRLDKICKGTMVEAFQYSDKFKVEKDGKYIKERLDKQKDSIQEEINDVMAKMAMLQSKLPQGLIPDSEPSSYVFEGIRKSAFDNYPKMFSYEVKHKYRQNGNGDGLKSYEDQGDDYDKMDIYQLMCKYNDCARLAISNKADLLWLDMLKETIKDNQKIELSGSMLKLMI